MGLRMSGGGERIRVPRVVGAMEAPSATFSFRGRAALDERGGVALWSKNLKSYRKAGRPVVLAAYDVGNPTPTRTLLIPAAPMRWARVARTPAGGWVIGGKTDADTQLLQVVAPSGAITAEATTPDTISKIVTDSEGFVWVLGSALTKYDRELRQLWQSPGGIRDDWSTDAVNLGTGEVLACQSDSEGNGVLLRIHKGRDTEVIQLPEVEETAIVIADDGWVGLAGDVEPTMIIGTVANQAFEERSRVRLSEDDRLWLTIDQVTCRGETAYVDDGVTWRTFTLHELLTDRAEPTPQDAAPPERRGWFGWGRADR